MAIFGFTGFNALFYTAGYYTSAINIGILQGSIPVVVLAGAYFMYGTRATLVQIAGVLITSIGVIVVATQGAPLSILEIGSTGATSPCSRPARCMPSTRSRCATARTCRASPSSRCWR